MNSFPGRGRHNPTTMISNRPLRDGQTVTVDHTLRTFSVTVRSHINVGPETIKNLIEHKFEVVDVKETDTVIVVQ